MSKPEEVNLLSGWRSVFKMDTTQPLLSQKEIEGMSDVLKRVARAKHARRKWRVKDYADGWIMYDSEEEARASEEAQNGALVEPAPE